MASNLVTSNLSEYSHFELINDAVIISDKNGNIVFVNGRVEQLFGYSYEELLCNYPQRLFSQALSDNNDDKIVLLPSSTGNNTRSAQSMDDRKIRIKDGTYVWTRWSYSNLEDGRLIQVVQDITAQKKLEETVDQLNSRNILLQQEVHHRIKNNMQIVISLLNLQFRSVEDPQALHSLCKSKQRMISISTVHNYLCSSKNLSINCFGEYLNRLLTYIQNENNNPQKIRLESKFSGHFKTTRHLVSLGLIISELVTNAYKHAFESNKEGVITVSLNCENDGQIVLCVADNGDGLKSPLNLKTPATMGYEIILTLIHQIEGRISLSSDKGTKVRVVFYQ